MQKQQLNVYTVMLLVSFFAILMAVLLLYMELRRWGTFPWWKAEAGGGVAQVHQPADSDLLPPPLKVQQMWS